MYKPSHFLAGIYSGLSRGRILESCHPFGLCLRTDGPISTSVPSSASYILANVLRAAFHSSATCLLVSGGLSALLGEVQVHDTAADGGSFYPSVFCLSPILFLVHKSNLADYPQTMRILSADNRKIFTELKGPFSEADSVLTI